MACSVRGDTGASGSSRRPKLNDILGLLPDAADDASGEACSGNSALTGPLWMPAGLGQSSKDRLVRQAQSRVSLVPNYSMTNDEAQLDLCLQGTFEVCLYRKKWAAGFECRR